jgi:RNA polymerase sigma-70 factor (ECF subfamily)
MEEQDDLQLIEDYQDGDQKAFEKLISRYLKTVYGFVVRMVGRAEADDLVQDVFVKIWKNLDKYNAQYSFKTWVLSIARNTVIDWYRKKKSLNFSDLDGDNKDFNFEESIVDREPLPDKIFEQKELSTLLDGALNTISPNNRSILVLHLEDGLTFEEISVLLGRPMNTVKSQYRRALIVLREYLTKNAPN